MNSKLKWMRNHVPDFRVSWRKYEITIPVATCFTVEDIYLCDPCKYQGRSVICDKVEEVYHTTSYILKRLNH